MRALLPYSIAPKGGCKALDAPKHGTLWAYRRYRCRCPEALEANNALRRAWESTPKGQAARRRYNEVRRARRRSLGPLTSEQHFRQEARDRAHRVLASGGTWERAALAAGVSVRTIGRWIAAQRGADR